MVTIKAGGTSVSARVLERLCNNEACGTLGGRASRLVLLLAGFVSLILPLNLPFCIPAEYADKTLLDLIGKSSKTADWEHQRWGKLERKKKGEKITFWKQIT